MANYLIRVEGALSDELVATFPTLDSSRRPHTVLHGRLTDQSSLTEVLEHLREIGVEVIDVHRVPAASHEPVSDEPPAPSTEAESPLATTVIPPV